MSWGNSSRLVRRKNRPIDVTRELPSTVWTCPGRILSIGTHRAELPDQEQHVVLSVARLPEKCGTGGRKPDRKCDADEKRRQQNGKHERTGDIHCPLGDECEAVARIPVGMAYTPLIGARKVGARGKRETPRAGLSIEAVRCIGSVAGQDSIGTGLPPSAGPG